MNSTMKYSAVVNASPLIYLGKLGMLHLLKNLFSEVITTQEVKDEVLKKPRAPEHSAIKTAFNDFIKLKAFKNRKLFNQLLKQKIHAGESSVIVLAVGFHRNNNNEKYKIILDDLESRQIAKSLGLELTGTIGLILTAVKENLIKNQEAEILIKNLVINTDFRISSDMFIRVLDELNKI